MNKYIYHTGNSRPTVFWGQA